jgi:uncharacterized protein (TIGR03435 family)
MKKIATCVTAIVLFFATALAAQDIKGTWQGTLHTPNVLRLVLKVSKADNAGLKADLFYNIDQDGTPEPVNTVSLQGTTFKFSYVRYDESYEGKLSADGNSIAGTWEQGLSKIPLVFERATQETEWTIPDPPPPVKMMAADFRPVYEVAAIKPSKPGTPRHSGSASRQLNETGNNTMWMIVWANELMTRQVIGAPDWLNSDNYDITAKMNGEGQPSDAQMKEAISQLLADRYQFKFHMEKRVMPGYELVVANGGPKLTKSESTNDAHGHSGTHGVFFFYNTDMVSLCRALGRNVLDRSVVDHTGVTGRYDFSLKWTPDEFELALSGASAPSATNGDAPPGIFTALQQQLGLKLREGKFPVDVLVIDHVEKPSEN